MIDPDHDRLGCDAAAAPAPEGGLASIPDEPYVPCDRAAARVEAAEVRRHWRDAPG